MAESTETRQFALEQVDKLLGQLAFQISRTLKSHDPRSIHSLRVAVRRFLQAFHAFEPCFQAKDVKKIRRQLKEIMIPARAVRDCDTAIALLPRSKVAESAAITAKFARQRKDAEGILLGMLKRWMQRKSSLKWRIKLQGAFAATKTFPQTAQEFAAELLPDLAKEFFERGKRAAQAEGSTEDLHQFSIAAKKLRYTLELFVTLYGPGLGEWLEQVRSIHALAGGVDDFAAVRRMVASDTGNEARDAALGKKHRKQIEKLRNEWTETFAGPDRARHRIHYLQDLAGKGEAPKKPMARSASASNAPTQRSQHA